MTNLLEMFADAFAPKKKEKVEPFLVVISDNGRAERYIKKFRTLLKKYPLVQNPNDKIKLSELQFGDIVVFGNSSAYDYTITEEPLMKLRNLKVYDLISDESRIASALDRYVEKNGICPCWRRKPAVKQTDFDVIISIEVEEQPKPKKVATIEVADIYDAFVKIGWNIYYTVTDTYTGKQYVNIDGQVFNIKTNLFGQKYLA